MSTDQSQEAFWKRRKRIEAWWPHVVAGIAALVTFVLLLIYRDWKPPEASKEVLAAVINVSAIAVGFLAASKSILLSMENGITARRLKALNQWHPLVRYLLDAAKVSFYLAAFSTILLVVDLKQDSWPRVCLITVWAFLVVAATGLCYRVIHLFGITLTAHSK